ncbi:MAG: hypothetical protein WKF82_10950 [Nocardioidaceae bacterium]
MLQPGEMAAGAALTVLSRPDHDITAELMFRALTTERTLLPCLLDVGDDPAPVARKVVEKYLACA